MNWIIQTLCWQNTTQILSTISIVNSELILHSKVSKQSTLLTLYVADMKFPELDQLTGQIYALSKYQQGCRFLQKKLEEKDEKNIAIILKELYNHLSELMTGNLPHICSIFDSSHDRCVWKLFVYKIGGEMWFESQREDHFKDLTWHYGHCIWHVWHSVSSEDDALLIRVTGSCIHSLVLTDITDRNYHWITEEKHDLSHQTHQSKLSDSSIYFLCLIDYQIDSNFSTSWIIFRQNTINGCMTQLLRTFSKCLEIEWDV